MTMKHALWVLGIATMAVYGALVFWAGPMLNTLANGALLPDLRVTGYAPSDMRALIAGAEPGFVPAYVRAASTLDRAVPVLAGATLVLALWSGDGFWRWLIIVPLVYAVADLTENALVVSFMTAETVTNSAVTRASMATQIKWFAVVAAFVLVALRGAFAVLNGRRE